MNLGATVGWFSRKSDQPDRVEPRIRNLGPESPDWLGNSSDQALVDYFRGTDSGTFGPAVSETSAMRISTVFACVKLGADLVSSAPLGVYRDSETQGRELARSHKLYALLHVNPFPGRPMTSATWRSLWVSHVWLWGNHYSIIRRDRAARVVGFEPVMPWMVEVRRTPDARNLYVIRDNGVVRETVDQDDMLHFSGPSFDGVVGLSRIQQFARDPIALAAVLQEQTGRVHENSSRPSGMLTMPPNITPDGKKRMMEHWNANQAGRANAGRVMFADKDSTYTPFQMSPEDLNTIEARRFQGADICRFFGTPPHMIGEAAGTSAWGSGIEQLTLGYKQFTLHPQLVDFEQELTLKLFGGSDFYPAFDRQSLVVMDAVTAAQVAATEIFSSVLLPNERRRQLQRAPIPGGDEPLVNAATVALKTVLNPPAPAAQPSTKGPPNAP